MATFMATHDQVRNLRSFPTLPWRGKNILAETTTTSAALRKLNATGGIQHGQMPRFRVIAAVWAALLYAAWVVLARA